MGTLCILGLISLRHREQIENKLQEALDSWKAEKWAPPTKPFKRSHKIEMVALKKQYAWRTKHATWTGRA